MRHGQGPLGLLNLASQLLDGTRVLAQVLVLLFLVFDEVLQKVLSAQVGVAVRGHHFS